MKLIIYGLLFSLFSLPLTTTSEVKTDSSIERYIREPKEVEVIIGKTEFRYAVDRDTAIQEVVQYWNYTFDSVGASKTDYRRLDFRKYAVCLVDSLRFYQNTLENKEVLLPQNIKTTMPNDKYTHLIIARIVYKESSINPYVIGRKFKEVGFMQLHGKALNGYSKEYIRKNPSLGMNLGIRWLAVAYNSCENFKSHTLDTWKGPLALYGAGPKAKKNGKCTKRFGFANKRVNHVKNYISNLIEI